MPQETWCEVPFHPSSPHLRCDDSFPTITTRPILGKDTPCLRWYGVAGGKTIRGVLFYFPLDAFPAVDPIDMAVLYVGPAGKIPPLEAAVDSKVRRALGNLKVKGEQPTVWFADMDGPDANGKRWVYLVTVVAIGDPVCGIILPRGAWMPDLYERFFAA